MEKQIYHFLPEQSVVVVVVVVGGGEGGGKELSFETAFERASGW